MPLCVFRIVKLVFKVELGWVYLVLHRTAYNNIWVQVFVLRAIG